MRWSTRTLAASLAVCVAACGWKVTPPPRPAPLAPPRHVADSIMLNVNDGGVVWGGGRLGEVVRQTLLDSRSFDQVFYPIEPRNPPPLRLVIKATGHVDEEIGLGIVKSIVIGALLFAPVGLIRFNTTYDLDADVVFLRDAQEVRRFHVKSSTGVSHTMFSQTSGYEPEAQNAAFRDLGERIAAELSQPGP